VVSVAPKQEWDVCAGDLLVHEAGGFRELARGERRYNQPICCCAPPLAAARLGSSTRVPRLACRTETPDAPHPPVSDELYVSELLIERLSTRRIWLFRPRGHRARHDARARHADRGLHVRGRPAREETAS
jgi:hypothetical protein